MNSHKIVIHFDQLGNGKFKFYSPPHLSNPTVEDLVTEIEAQYGKIVGKVDVYLGSVQGGIFHFINSFKESDLQNNK